MHYPGHSKANYDRVLLLVALVLLCLGVVIISSASIMESTVKYFDSMYQTKRHFIGISIAVLLSIVCAMTPSAFWKKNAVYALFIVLCLLILVLIVGREINGAKRWLNLGFMNLQPAELLKIVWILYFSSYVNRRIEAVSTTLGGFLKPGVFIGIFALLLMLQPDLGSTFVVALITFSIMCMAGVGLLKFIGVLVIFGLAGVVAVAFSPYRLKRVTSFLDPWADEFGDGYQLTQSLMAFGRGSWFGEGLGNSYQKLGYLPEAHTDFVTAIYGEEFGFIGMCVLILLEFVIVYKAASLGIKILKNDAIYQGYVAIGISAWFAVQTFINIAAASGGIPTKGLTLPLVSYGGSSLMVFCASIAILLRIDFDWRNKKIEKKR